MSSLRQKRIFRGRILTRFFSDICRYFRKTFYQIVPTDFTVESTAKSRYSLHGDRTCDLQERNRFYRGTEHFTNKSPL